MAVPQERLDAGTVEIHADHAGYESILTPAALGFLARLQHRFDATRQRLLQARRERQAGYDAGGLPDFRADTLAIRESDWTVAPIPAAFQDRRAEITVPFTRKIINKALNSGPKVYRGTRTRAK